MAQEKRLKPFKTCTVCGFVWPGRSSFLSDPGVRLIGYQAHFEELTAGLFQFNHSCGTTLSIEAYDFQDLYDGPIFTEQLSGTDECRGYCMDKEDLRPCVAKCECSYVRELLQVILNWPKSQPRPDSN